MSQEYVKLDLFLSLISDGRPVVDISAIPSIGIRNFGSLFDGEGANFIIVDVVDGTFVALS